MQTIFQAMPPCRKVTVTWYHGPSGSGKTRRAVSSCPVSEVWVQNDSHWFDGYVGQPTIVLDGKTRPTLSLLELLNIIDNYCIKLPVKGGCVEAKYTKVVVTALTPPAQFFAEDIAQCPPMGSILARCMKDKFEVIDTTPEKKE